MEEPDVVVRIPVPSAWITFAEEKEF